MEYIPTFTEDDIFNKYVQLFGEDSVWKNYTNIRNSIREQQSRPKAARLLIHRGGQEPDAEHLNKSYDMFYQDGKTYMIPIEGMIAALRYRVETTKMMDVKGLTRFHALDAYGYAMCMYRSSNGEFYVHSYYRDHCYSEYGPREVSF